MENVLKAANFGFKYKTSIPNEMNDDNENQVSFVVEWSLEDKQRLIEVLSDQGPNGIHWESISKETFNDEYTPEECALQFLSLPISEQIMLRFQTPVAGRSQHNSLREGAPLTTTIPTVF